MSKPFNIHDWQAKQRLIKENIDGKKSMEEFIKVVEKAPNSEEIFEKFENWVESFAPGLLNRDLSEYIDEINATGTGASFNAGAGEGYATPNAFKKKRKRDLNEVSYSDFKRNTESSPRQKIARGISQVNKMIKEIEKIVSHNFRLKTELDMNSGTFLNSTNKKIHEIGARLKQLENKLREFSN